MRLFTALVPPARALEAVRTAVDGGRRTAPGLRWAPEAEWHITLVFLGEVGEERVPDLADALGDAAAAHGPLSLAVRGWGAFPVPERASVLWAGVDGDTGALGDLVRDLREAAGSCGVRVERRPYTPHLTVARSSPARDLTGTVRGAGAPHGRGWRAREVHLLESRPGTTDRYRTARTWALGWKPNPDPHSERSTS